MARVLSTAEAKRFYDRFGRLQDGQVVYEGRALALLEAGGRFEEAAAVFEFGCGTGALARRLFQHRLPAEARYVGVDVSETMVRIARRRLRCRRERAEVRLTAGEVKMPDPDAGFDRFVSCYVMDLLSEETISALLEEAHRLLCPGGLLCLASLTDGATPPARLLSRIWGAVQGWKPALTGGCRPIRLTRCLDSRWAIEQDRLVTQLGVTSEVIIARSRLLL